MLRYAIFLAHAVCIENKFNAVSSQRRAQRKDESRQTPTRAIRSAFVTDAA